MTFITGVCVLTSSKVKTLLWLIWFLWLPILPQFSNAAGVGPSFKVCISAKVLLPIVGN